MNVKGLKKYMYLFIIMSIPGINILLAFVIIYLLDTIYFYRLHKFTKKVLFKDFVFKIIIFSFSLGSSFLSDYTQYLVLPMFLLIHHFLIGIYDKKFQRKVLKKGMV